MAVRIEALAGLETMMRELALDHPDGWESFDAGDLVNRTPRGFVRRFVWPARSGDVYYFKLYRLGRPWKRFRSAFRKDPARREFENLSWLRDAGLPAVQPVAWGCRRRLRVVRACFLVTRGEPALENLETLLDRGPAPRSWVTALARLVRKMHDGGFFAHDLHLRNVMAGQDALRAGAREPRFFLLDFPNGRVLAAGHPGRRSAMVYDLASLDRDAMGRVSRSARLRFLRDYQGDRHVDRDLVTAIGARRTRQLEKHSKSRERSPKA